jgi:hypothetical protein
MGRGEERRVLRTEELPEEAIKFVLRDRLGCTSRGGQVPGSKEGAVGCPLWVCASTTSPPGRLRVSGLDWPGLSVFVAPGME